MQQAGDAGRVYRSEHARRTADPSDPAAVPPVAPVVAATTPPAAESEPVDPIADEQGSAAGHSAVMALGSLVSRITGFARTVVIAAALGSTVVGNAYTNAQIFPGMIYELLLGAIMTSVLVPVLVRARKSDPDRGDAYAQRLVTLAVLGLGAATALAVAAAPLLAILVAEPDARGLITALSYLILPTIFFYGMAAILTGVLNTRGHFAAPMWAPILNNLVVIGIFGLYLLLFGPEPPTATNLSTGKVLLLGGGTLLGIVVQAIGLLPALRRVGYRWRWRFDFRALGLRELGRLGAWMIIYIAANQIAVIVVMRLVNRATDDDPSNAGLLIYNNVFLLLMMAHGIVAVSIIVALLPRMSAAAADGRYAEVAAYVSRGARMAAAVLAPIAVAYAVLAVPISVTLFQWGAFTPEMAGAMAPVLLITGLALVPFSVGQVTTFAFYSLQDTRTPALVNVGVVVLRIGVQVGLYVALASSLVAAGMMLGNAVSYLATAVVMAWLLRRRLGRIGLREIIGTLLRVLLAAGGAALVGLGVLWLFGGDGQPGKLAAAVQLVVAGGALGAAYIGLALLLRVQELREVLGMVTRKLGRR